MVQLKGYGELDFEKALPKDWSGKVLKGASSGYWAANNVGSILMQKIKDEDFALTFYEMNFWEDSVLITEKQKGLGSVLVMDGQMEVENNDITYRMNTGKFILHVGEDGEYIFRVPKKTNCQWLCFHFQPTLYKSLKKYFPFLDRDINNSSGHPIQEDPIPVRMHFFDSLLAQFYSYYSEELQTGYVRIKVEESLFSFLAQHYYPLEKEPLSKRDIEMGEEAYNLILKDLSVHLSNDTIAAKVGINETDLKRIFKARFEMGMFQLLKAKRFALAKEQLLQGKEITEILPSIGYKRSTTFLREFKKFYKYSALDLRNCKRK